MQHGLGRRDQVAVGIIERQGVRNSVEQGRSSGQGRPE
jgi:hypothetical protein